MTHDAPCLTITDKLLLKRFLDKFGIDSRAGADMLITQVASAFSHLPYENLTKIIKTSALVNPKSAMRYPGELIGDYLRFGTGGTCFSLTAATVAVYDALGINAHPVLADRHYGVDTHCGLIIFRGKQLFLLDPGYLLFVPVPLHSDRSSSVDTGTNNIELKPLRNGQKFELYTTYKNNRKLRLVYKIAPVDASQFAKAWESSFAWEMMNYPVLTRRAAGAQHYLQGDKFAVYTTEGSKRFVLDDDNTKAGLIASSFGIDPQVIKKALEIIR
ncbi:MAG: hypothetical protein LBI42_05015 [Chitinispirillales bacterium]|jgi:arylamine N-acetyltransferase|nr:hypothetical protein [Chitinispirillales bacterium]